MSESSSSPANTVFQIGSTVLMASAAILLAALALWRSGSSAASSDRSPPPPLPTEPLDLTSASVKGNRRAKVAVLEFADFECPFCASFSRQSLPALQRRFIDTGAVLFAFRHLPLQSIHKSAFRLAEMAECAGRQDRFWPLHDRLFARPNAASRADVTEHAGAAGLKVESFLRCVDGGARNRVHEDLDIAKALGVDGTPTFFIGTLIAPHQLAVTARVSGDQLTAITAEVERLLSKVAR